MSNFDSSKAAVNRHIADKTSLFGDIGVDGQSDGFASREAEYIDDIREKIKFSVEHADSAAKAFDNADADLKADGMAFINDMTNMWSDAQNAASDRRVDIVESDTEIDDGISVGD